MRHGLGTGIAQNASWLTRNKNEAVAIRVVSLSRACMLMACCTVVRFRLPCLWSLLLRYCVYSSSAVLRAMMSVEADWSANTVQKRAVAIEQAGTQNDSHPHSLSLDRWTATQSFHGEQATMRFLLYVLTCLSSAMSLARAPEWSWMVTSLTKSTLGYAADILG